MSKKTFIKITSDFLSSNYPFIDRTGRVKRGHFCRLCGSPLKDELSKKRGYGRRCFKSIPVRIIIEIPSEEDRPE